MRSPACTQFSQPRRGWSIHRSSWRFPADWRLNIGVFLWCGFLRICYRPAIRVKQAQRARIADVRGIVQPPERREQPLERRADVEVELDRQVGKALSDEVALGPCPLAHPVEAHSR